MVSNNRTENYWHLTRLIVMLLVSFILPILGIMFSIYILLKEPKTNTPAWIRFVAAISIIYQLSIVALISLSIIVSTEQTDNIISTLIK